MGVGGVVVTGFTQGVKVESEHERYLHNQRVLREAKQALLQYAYNYPVTNGFGPGRLPCPDTNNNGAPNPVFYCGGPNGIVGRFPWAEPKLNFYDARDATGERLWYAVSRNFANQGPLVKINSDTAGSITIRDRSGGLRYDGADLTPASGVAAVIIAPGAAITRNGILQNRAAAPNNPASYLDRFGANDNATFINQSTDNGFVNGPIESIATGDLVINDQMIVVTASEVIAMAEKATLQAYRKAILDYLDKTGGVYPWLYNYEDIEYIVGTEDVDVAIEKLSSLYPVDPVFSNEKDTYLGIDTSGDDDGIFGRIPSFFSEYFTRGVSLPIESDLKITVTIDYSAITPVPATISHGNLPLLGDGVNPPEHVLEFTIPADELTDLRFTEDADDPKGRLTATLAAARTENQLLYFWDEDESGRTGNWRLCPNGGDEISDCHRDGGQNPTPGGANDSREEILILDLVVSLPAGTITFDTDFSAAPTSVVSAGDGDGHATISATVQGTALDLAPAAVTAPSIKLFWQYDAHYHEDPGGSDPPEVFEMEEQNANIDDGLDPVEWLGGTTVELEMRFYPELPYWAYEDGWHNAIRMAYALEYKPPATGPCIIDTTCLKLDDAAQTPQDKISLLVLGGEHDWIDTDNDGELADEMEDDKGSVFDNGNTNDNATFYRRRNNDKILVIEEL
jgi:hypothetical protein